MIRSFDIDLTVSEKQKLNEALKSSESLRLEKSELENMRSLLKHDDFAFEDGFADRVMEKITPSEKENFIFTPEFFNVFKRFALTGLAAIILLLISIYFIDGSISLDSLYGISNYSPEETELALFTLEDFE